MVEIKNETNPCKYDHIYCQYGRCIGIECVRHPNHLEYLAYSEQVMDDLEVTNANK